METIGLTVKFNVKIESQPKLFIKVSLKIPEVFIVFPLKITELGWQIVKKLSFVEELLTVKKSVKKLSQPNTLVNVSL